MSNVDKKSADGQHPVRLVNYTDVYYQDRITPELNLMSATATAEQVLRFGVRAGDSIITKDSETPDDIANAAYVAEAQSDMVCGYHLALVRPHGSADGRFLSWALRSDYVQSQYTVAANGMTRYGLSYDAIESATIPVPLLADQRRIADFLDDQVARIDNIIAARRTQADLHDEQQSGLVDDAVDYDGHPRARLALFATIQSGITVDAGRAVEDGVETPYVRVANVQAGSLNLDEIKAIVISKAMRSRFLLRDGDVLMTEGGDIDKLGRGTVWRSEIPGAVHQNHVFAVRPDAGRLLPGYLAYITACSNARAYFESTGNQTTNLASTSATKVLDLPIPVRSLREQANVAARLDKIVTSHEARQTSLTQSVRLFDELKRSLITAAVTGEFDVSSADGSRVTV